ncbi:MAG: tetratricopeptide repeat protein, partial [Rhabdochlamydiaceae bacterium]
MDFRRKLESTKELLYHTFDQTTSFEKLLRRFLGRWLLDREREASGQDKLPKTITPLSSLPENPEHEISPPTENSTPVEISSPAENSSLTIAEAQRLADEGKITEAEVIFSKALENGTAPEIFQAYAEFLMRVGRLGQAEQMYHRLLDLARHAGKKWEVRALGGLGRIMLAHSNYKLAETNFRAALELAEKLSLPLDIAAASLALGRLIATRKNEEEKGVELVEMALKVYLHRGNEAQVASAYNALGVIKRAKHANEAEQLFKGALKLFRDCQNDEGTAKVLNNLGNLYRTQEEYSQAASAYEEALMINSRLGRIDGLALNHRNLGILAKRLED